MARQATGSVRERSGVWYARVTIGPGKRPSFALPTCTTRAHALERLAILTDIVARLRATGHEALAVQFVERAAARDGKALAAVVDAVGRIVSGQAPVPSRGAQGVRPATFRDFGEDWTEGRIHAQWPDLVKKKRSSKQDKSRLEKHVYPLIGEVPLASITIEHADAVMRSLPIALSPASRRQVAQAIHRILALAVYPARLIERNPVPRGFLPGGSGSKALNYLYPDEDAALLASPLVPLGHRLVYGFVAREGLRRSEAEALTWGDLDLERGALALDENKTDDPRLWALDPGVLAALKAWRGILGDVGPEDPVFVDLGTGEPVDLERAAEGLRDHLKAAKVTRAALFEDSETRQPMRFHDLRATFVTVSLAAGRLESWVMDRTGHTTSAMVHRYRRVARSLAEMGKRELRPLVLAIPELAAAAQSGPETGPAADSEGGHTTGKPYDSEGVGHEGLEPSTNGLRIHGGGALECGFDGLSRTKSTGLDTRPDSGPFPGVRAAARSALEALLDRAREAGDDELANLLIGALAALPSTGEPR